jgi:hypothetical protein
MSRDHGPMHTEAHEPGGISAGRRKPWSTPRVIVSDLHSNTMTTFKSFPSSPDQKASASTPFGS